MSNTIQINLDNAAFEVRRNLDNATAYLEARNASINHGNGLIEAVSAHVQCELILHNLDHKFIEERERFEELRSEARALMSKFWGFFKLFPITRADGTQAVAQIVAPTVKHVGENRLQPHQNGKAGQKGRDSYKRLTDEEKKRLIDDLKRGGPYTTLELRKKAIEWGIGFSTIGKYYYKLFR